MTTGMPILMPTEDMPQVERYLFVGGPKHGQRIEVVKGDAVHKVFAPGQPASLMAQDNTYAGGFDVHTYVRQRLGMKDQGGVEYSAVIYVHDQIPNQYAQHLLMEALVVDFVRANGERVSEQ